MGLAFLLLFHFLSCETLRRLTKSLITSSCRCNSLLSLLQLLLLVVRKQLLDLQSQRLILLNHLVDRQFQKNFVGVLNLSQTLSLLITLSLDKDVEGFRSERKKRLIVHLSGSIYWRLSSIHKRSDS